jgi:hypothetical protein
MPISKSPPQPDELTAIKRKALFFCTEIDGDLDLIVKLMHTTLL